LPTHLRGHRCGPGGKPGTIDPEIKTLSAGIVLIRNTVSGCRFLVLRAYRYWDFPKGVVGPEETPLDAACREVAEETGITDPDFCWGEAYCETEPYGAGKVARYYLARASTRRVELRVSPELGRAEHDEYRWVDYGGAARLLNERVRRVLYWAATSSGCLSEPQAGL